MTASTPAIRFRSVGKQFTRGKQTVTALENITLDVETGRILAVIGFSGAGKSTLVRLINALERPTSGTVEIEGTDLATLDAKRIRALRARIGMVFQQFNLVRSRTVYANVAYPLEVAGWDKKRQLRRITELLHFVGLTEKAWAYPDELSGGQKQRVGIARALATNPDILLADESTSALDPDTTKDVLALLRRVNDELGVTIVVITHEMDVVRELADDVAVLEHGRLVEAGPAEKVLAHPEADATRRLVGATLRTIPDAREADALRRAHGERLVTLTVHDARAFGRTLAGMGSRGVEPEIVHGGLTPLKGGSITTLTLALHGSSDDVADVVGELRASCDLQEVFRMNGTDWSTLRPVLMDSIWQTLQMVLATIVLGSIFGLVLGVLLNTTRRGGILENRVLHTVLNIVVNIIRPIPFIIFAAALGPLTLAVTGSTIGTASMIFPLTLAATFGISRIVEQNLVSVDPGVVEAAQSMGASPWHIIRTVLIPEALAPLILGFTFALVAVVDMTAVVGAMGGGGLGNFALSYGYQRFNWTATWTAVIIIIVFVQIAQFLGNTLARKALRR